MSAALFASLYAFSGACAYAALQHGAGALRHRGRRSLLLFSVLSLLAMAATLLRAGAALLRAAPELGAVYRWEFAIGCLFFAAFSWFLAEYTGAPGRAAPIALASAWAGLFAALAGSPGIRIDAPGPWLYPAGAAFFGALAYATHCCIATYRKGQWQKARALAGALAVFFGAIILDAAARRGLVSDAPPAEFGFAGLLLLMAAKAAHEPRDQNRRMRSVLDHVPAAISLKDPQGRYRLVNRAFEEFFKLSDAGVRGKADGDLFPRELAERFTADDRRALDSRQNVEREDVLNLDGTLRSFQRYVFPLLRPSGAPYGVCSVRLDITETRRKERALHKVSRQVWHTDRVASVGALSVSLAHELSQPLCAILNNSQAGLRFLAQDAVDLEEIRAIFQDIVRDEKRASGVVNGLRAFLRKQEMPFAGVDLAQCIEETLDLLHSEILRRGAAIEAMLDSDIAVWANKTQVQQVVVNLITNALDAMAELPEDARILQVRARRDEGQATVAVRDNGPGIPADMAPLVFEGFHTTKPEGLGIGLAVCKSIVESHQGHIWLEDNADRGVTFSFTLRLARHAPRAA
jgi:PAS domain S-box-containing protein